MEAEPEKTTMDFVLKNGRPMAVIISIDRYERLMKVRSDITEY